MGLKKFPLINFVQNREQFLLNLCREKVVLHLGCADALHLEGQLQRKRHLHLMIKNVAEKVYGVDINEKAIRKLSELGVSNLYCRDVEKLNIKFETNFDIIIAGELIEHLSNPGVFLDSISKYMTDNTLLILTTPNLLSLKLFLYSIFGYQRIHYDHSVGFTFSLLMTLLTSHNYKITKWITSVERFPSKRNWFANIILRGIFWAMPHWSDTILVIARYQVCRN